ncbi:hypothetical protein DBB_37980 [Desulfoluna spongiiphila]|nr:hypothetical protein DBB_37980 [Desulfoluna spongiiphila]
MVMVCPKCDGKIVAIDSYLNQNPDMKAKILQYIEDTEKSDVVDYEPIKNMNMNNNEEDEK